MPTKDSKMLAGAEWPEAEMSALERLVADSSMCAIAAMDLEGRLTAFSKGAERIFGISADEVLGRSALALGDPEERAKRASELSRILGRPVAADLDVITARPRLGMLEEGEWTAFKKNGQRIWVQISLTATRDRQGALTGYLCIFTDITERKKHEAALRESEQRLRVMVEKLSAAKAAAEQASRSKSEFLANMSHEIRTPMNGVLGMTALLLDTSLTEEQRGYAQNASRCASALLTIINDVLDLSKIEAQMLVLEPINFDLRRAVEETMALISENAREKGLQLDLSWSSGLPSFVIGDPGRLRQILTNFLSNAVKFTERGAVSVRASILSSDGERCRVRLSVRDSGIGIPADKLGKIFEKFVQADASTTRRYGGTGLGLAISRQLAELMNGEIGVESEPGVGSTFWLDVPFAMAASAARTSLLPSAVVRFDGARVLVAEDNAVNQKVAARMLEKLGCKVDLAVDGRQACALAETNAYDLVFMDCQMPEMDGYEATLLIRRNKPLLPVIAMTAHAMQGDRERCLEAGMNDYLTKPIAKNAVIDALLTWLSKD